MQCGVEERIIRRYKAVVVKCFKCGKKGHKCREHLLWEKTKRRGCTSLILVNVLPQVHLYHNAPLFSSSTLLLNSFSILAVLLVAWPHTPPHFPLPSSTSFLLSVPLSMPASSLAVSFVVLPHADGDQKV